MSRCTPTYVEQKNLQRDDMDEGTAGREASGEGPVGMPKWVFIGARVLDAAKEREAVVHGIGQPYALHHEQPSCVWLRPPGPLRSRGRPRARRPADAALTTHHTTPESPRPSAVKAVKADARWIGFSGQEAALGKALVHEVGGDERRQIRRDATHGDTGATATRKRPTGRLVL